MYIHLLYSQLYLCAYIHQSVTMTEQIWNQMNNVLEMVNHKYFTTTVKRTMVCKYTSMNTWYA